MLRSSKSPNFQSNICREVASQHKNMFIVIEILELAFFWIFLLQRVFFIHNFSKHFLWSTKGWLTFYFLSLINCYLPKSNFLKWCFISYYTYSPKLPAPQRSRWKIYRSHLFYISKELINKTLIGFLKARVIYLTIVIWFR